MTSTNLKAIETRYAGCHFRSRLEARWAVFFDTLGIAWQYEPQGFELGSTYYLPDFRLPGIKVWIEVKGSLHPIDPKWHEFHDIINDYEILSYLPADQHVLELHIPEWSTSCETVPWRTFMAGQVPRPDPPSSEKDYAWGVLTGPGSPHAGWAWCQCLECGAYDLAHVAIDVQLHCGHITCLGLTPQMRPRFKTSKLVAAYTAARSARFEHGQSGAT